MSFENIDYEEVYETEDWVDSRWYEIVTSRFMFVTFRATTAEYAWHDETRYVLDKVFFWTMPVEDMDNAEKFWENIRATYWPIPYKIITTRSGDWRTNKNSTYALKHKPAGTNTEVQ